MGKVPARRRVLRIKDVVVGHRPGTLVAEKPREIRVRAHPSQ